MQALADMALAHSPLRPRIFPLLESMTRTDTPAVRSRGRKLLATLKRQAQIESFRIAARAHSISWIANCLEWKNSAL
jgi:hypothetical protein